MNYPELQVCPKHGPQSTQPQESPVPAPRTNNVTSDDSSDENEDIKIAIGAPGRPVPVPVELDTPPLRRSAWLNKGQHRNLHHQPMIVVSLDFCLIVTFTATFSLAFIFCTCRRT